jgi:transposase
MTVPGVNTQTAIGFIASVGDVRRFRSPKKLVAYLGLDPRVRQSGESAARHGRISKAGRASARHVLSESAWSVAMTPGPMKAFFERLRARRGAQVAAVATARKLAVLFWHLLNREEDYAFARPSMTRQKLRALQLATGAAPQRGRQHADGPLRNPKVRAAERRVSEQGEIAYRRLTPIGSRSRRRRAPARHRSAHLVGRRAAKQRGRDQLQNLRFSSSSGPAPEANSRK